MSGAKNDIETLVRHANMLYSYVMGSKTNIFSSKFTLIFSGAKNDVETLVR